MSESLNGEKPLQVRLGSDLRRRFKIVCTDEGKSMSDVLRNFVLWYTEKREKEKQGA